MPADVLWVLAHRRSNGKIGRQIRLDLHLDVLQFLPIKARVDGKDQYSESGSFATTLEADRIYLADRDSTELAEVDSTELAEVNSTELAEVNFIDFCFLHAMIDIGSDFVSRLKKSGPNIIVQQTLELTEKDILNGVTQDQIVTLPGCQNSKGFGEKQLRIITVFDPVERESVRLITTLLDVPAWLIGQLYRHRWSIELFFGWLKCVAKVKHLFSESSNGITMQFYIMIIATLILYLNTGARPSIYTIVILDSAARGNLRVEKAPEVLERIAREKELERIRRSKKKNS